MAYNKELIIENYNSISEEERACASLAESLEFYYTKKVLKKYVGGESKVIELGCATGYYGAFLADRCRSYTGVDLTPKHIDLFQETIDQKGWHNVTAQVGDATDLRDIPDDAYDVVLVLGPMYHLPPQEREKVFRESRRVCVPGGVILYAYINKVGAYLRACMMESVKHRYPNPHANALVLEQGVDDLLPDVFFFSMPEEMEEAAARHGLTVVDNVGVDFTFNADDINQMSHERLDAWLELTGFMMGHRSCTGMSNHALLVCRNS